MSLEAWLLFCLTEFVLCLSPGPSVLLVSTMGMTLGKRSGVLASTGVLSANAIYFALSATGLALLITSWWEVFVLIKWIGAAYLIWLGLTMLRQMFTAREAPIRGPSPGAGRAFSRGFVTQAANPKLIIYFAAILPQFIDPRASAGEQILILALTSFVIEFAVLAGYAAVGAAVARFGSDLAQRWLGGLGGALLIAAGAGLASIDRDG
jgi:threonine/homoserine/homoserine lactone efflux protein